MELAELRKRGYDVDAAAHARLAQFVAALLLENEKLNLTAIRTPESSWRLHLCDSLALLPLLRAARPKTLLDVGAGGGVPGIPLACVAAELRVTLLDATAKKIAACQRIINSMRLANVTTATGRAETVAHEPRFREHFDAVTARAVAPLPALLEYVAGFTRVGGQCWLFKSEQAAAAEVQAAAKAAKSLRLAPRETVHYDLDADGGRRVILVYEKTAPLPTTYPRRDGQIARKPL